MAKTKEFQMLTPEEVGALTPEAQAEYYAGLHAYTAALLEKNANLSDANKELAAEVANSTVSVGGKRPVVEIDGDQYEVIGKVHTVKNAKGEYVQMNIDDIIKDKELCKSLIGKKSGIFKPVEKASKKK